jgi:hypothetical protein
MERIRYIDHDGRKILLVDCSGCSPKEVAEVADQLPEFVKPQPARSVLLLADFSGAKMDRDSAEHVKIAAVKNRGHLRRSAWVFNGNIPKPLHDSIKAFSNRDIPQFENREEALQFLLRAS